MGLLNNPAFTPFLLAFVAYLALLAIYRLYLSPIAKFPGPKLAALSNWYEFYYDVIRQGQFTWHIQELHKQYGELPHEATPAPSRGPSRTRPPFKQTNPSQAPSSASRPRSYTSTTQTTTTSSMRADLAGATSQPTLPAASATRATASRPSTMTSTASAARPSAPSSRPPRLPISSP